MPKVHRFLEDHIDLNLLEMVGDPDTVREANNGNGPQVMRTKCTMVLNGKAYTWNRTGDDGQKEVCRAHAELLETWKAMDDRRAHEEDL